jgi:8-oxo-dGTP diphosphatase
MLIRKVAAVILLNPEAKILIMKRSSKKKIHPNLWGLPSGGVESGENIKETAIRETFEETGISIRELKKGPTISYEVSGGLDKLTYLYAKAETSEVSLNDEHSEYRWVKPQETLDYKFGIPRKDVKKVLIYFGLLQI